MNNKIKIALLLMIASGNQLFSSAAVGGGGGGAAAADIHEYENLSPQQKVWTLAQEGRVDELRKLLDEYELTGIKVDLSPWNTKIEKSPLFIAVKNDHVDVVRLLLEKGACLDVTYKYGFWTERLTVIEFAAKHGSFNVIRWLFSDSKIDAAQLNLLLNIAVVGGHVEVVQWLLLGKKIDATQLNLLLNIAVNDGHVEVVRWLLLNNANVNTVNRDEKTVLMVAAESGHAEIVQLLLDSGADVNAEGFQRQKALMCATRGGHAEIVQLLLESGADVNAVHAKGKGALAFAAESGRAEIVQLLLNKGAYVNQMSHTSLYFAAESGHAEIVQLLLDSGADVNAADYYTGGTALMCASMNGSLEVVRELLANGANINAENHRGRTALMDASMYGSLEVVRELLANGANINAEDCRGGTALMCASDRGHVEIVRLIQEKIDSLGDEAGSGRADASVVSAAEAVAALDQSDHQGGGADADVAIEQLAAEEAVIVDDRANADDVQPAAEMSGDFITEFNSLTEPNHIIEALSGWLSDNFTLDGEALQLLDDSNIDLLSVQAKQVLERLQSRNVPSDIMRQQVKVFGKKISVSALIRKLKPVAARVSDHQGGGADADVQPAMVALNDRANAVQVDREESDDDSFGDIDLGGLDFAETAGLASHDRGWGNQR